MANELQQRLIKTLAEQFSQNTAASSFSTAEKEDLIKGYIFILHDNISLLENALDILDTSTIKEFHCPTLNRKYWIVCGSKSHEYVCLQNFCPCRSFYEQARVTQNEIMVHET